MPNATPRRLTVALSGSTGPHYGVRLLEVLRDHYPEIERHAILSNAARKTIAYEMGRDPDEVARIAHVLHDEKNIGASIASGTFVTDGMAVAPCSMKTLSAIANSYNDNLIARAADVCLKERRPLVLVVRETPFHIGHLKLMQQVAENGGVILPPVPAFYHLPRTIDDLIDHTVVKVLDQFGLHVEGLIQRWEGLPPGIQPPGADGAWHGACFWAGMSPRSTNESGFRSLAAAILADDALSRAVDDLTVTGAEAVQWIQQVHPEALSQRLTMLSSSVGHTAR